MAVVVRVIDSTEDFFGRNAALVAEDIRPKPTKHRCPCPPGRRVWFFTWTWPFIHTYISRPFCLCDIVEILDSLGE